MKKILIAIGALAVLLMSSCTKDFVTVKHNSSEPQSEYYINESRMYEGLVAAYDPLQWYDYFYQYTSLNMISDIMADDVYCGGSNDGDQPNLVKIHYYNSTVLASQLTPKWIYPCPPRLNISSPSRSWTRTK